LLAPRPTPKLEEHLSSAVRDCLFNFFAATLLIGGCSSNRNLTTPHAVVTGNHYMVYLYSFFNLGARWRLCGQRHAPANLPPGKTRYRLWAPGADLDGCGKYRPHRGKPLQNNFVYGVVVSPFFFIEQHSEKKWNIKEVGLPIEVPRSIVIQSIEKCIGLREI